MHERKAAWGNKLHDAKVSSRGLVYSNPFPTLNRSLCVIALLYSVNVIMADEKFPLFHQYLRYSQKWGTIVFRIAGAIL